MPLLVYNPSHTAKDSDGYVNIATADKPWPTADILHIRATSVSLTAGANTTPVITLPFMPSHMTWGLYATTGGSVTDGKIEWCAAARGVTYGTNTQPRPTDDDLTATAPLFGTMNGAYQPAFPRTAADTNVLGFVGPQIVTEAFVLRTTGIAGAATALDISIEVHRAV